MEVEVEVELVTEEMVRVVVREVKGLGGNMEDQEAKVTREGTLVVALAPDSRVVVEAIVERGR